MFSDALRAAFETILERLLSDVADEIVAGRLQITIAARQGLGVEALAARLVERLHQINLRLGDALLERPRQADERIVAVVKIDVLDKALTLSGSGWASASA